MPVAVRTCETIDFPFVLRCMMALAQECPDRPAMSFEQASTMVELFRDKPDLGRLLVIEREGGIVGYAIVSVGWSREALGTVVTVEELYVTPASRGHGVTSALLGWLHAQWAGRAKSVRMEVEPGDERFRGLCRRLGFVATPFVRLERALPERSASLPPPSQPRESRRAQC